MPIRVKSRPISQGDRLPSPSWAPYESGELPEIGYDDAFRDVVKKLSTYWPVHGQPFNASGKANEIQIHCRCDLPA
jgi:hypothetical protein